MKTIGLIGGMSWESTTLYYQTMNLEVARRLGGLHSARILLSSLRMQVQRSAHCFHKLPVQPSLCFCRSLKDIHPYAR